MAAVGRAAGDSLLDAALKPLALCLEDRIGGALDRADGEVGEGIDNETLDERQHGG